MLVVAPMPFVIFCLLYAIILTLILLHGECCLIMSSFFGGVAFTIPVGYERSMRVTVAARNSLSYAIILYSNTHTISHIYIHPHQS